MPNNTKTFTMTEEEEKTFYDFVAKENACYYSLSAEVMNGLNLPDDKLREYVDMMSGRLADTLVESNKFLNSLSKKYNIKNGFKVHLNIITPNEED